MLETPYEHDNTEGVGKQYDKSGNLKIETPFKNAKKEGTEKVYYPSGDLGIEIQHTNNKINGIVKLYNKEKSLSGKQPHEMENLLAENALVVKPLQTHTLKD